MPGPSVSFLTRSGSATRPLIAHIPWGGRLCGADCPDYLDSTDACGGVALIPRCAECEAAWLSADEAHWGAYLTDDEPPELAFYCPECAEREFES